MRRAREPPPQRTAERCSARSAASGAGPARPSRWPRTAPGGTPTPTTTTSNTATSSASPTSCGARSRCARQTPACSVTSRVGTCSRSAAAPRRARAGWRSRARGSPRSTCPPACCAYAAAANEATGVDVPLVRANAERLPFASETFDIACSAFGAVPFVADLARDLPRDRAGAAAGRLVGVRGDSPDAVDLPGRPRPERPARHRLVLRPHPVRRGRRGRRTPPTSSTTARWATSCAR